MLRCTKQQAILYASLSIISLESSKGLHRQSRHYLCQPQPRSRDGACEKRKPTYTSSCTQINAFIISLRQTQTPTVVAAPQLLTSLQCQNKGTCSTLTPKCTSDSFFSLQTPHTTEQVNRNQGRHAATAHKQRKEVPVWLLFQVP